MSSLVTSSPRRSVLVSSVDGHSTEHPHNDYSLIMNTLQMLLNAYKDRLRFNYKHARKQRNNNETVQDKTKKQVPDLVVVGDIRDHHDLLHTVLVFP